MTVVVNFILILCQVLSIAIIIRIVLSWFVRPNNPAMVVLYQITEPVLAPLRRIIPNIGMLDLTPLVAIIIFSWVIPLLVTLLVSAF